ncbi:hypothetical protein BDA96_07G210100 [Sorghum bicolor]|uniref:Stomagen C-terminal domain-containing protein n=1 Tax=Sorghum bicolor TaxID=4558 RepID=A0A921UB94_SORBI|nr:hypothetical protein BDA96_07G210100 [Sorghum bicolor]
MAAAYGSTRQQQQLRRCVALCRLLLVAVLVIIGYAVLADARAGSPRTDEVALQTGQLQGFSRRSSTEALTTTTTTAAAGGWTALDTEQQAAAGGGGRRRMLVGSRAPTCTYNECRGCRHRCSVQEVPIDASDPINSAYHYKCICHL